MDPISLMILASAFGSSFLGGGQNTSSNSSETTTTLSPEMQKIADQILQKAMAAFNQPYPGSTTPAGTQLDALIPQLSGQISSAQSQYQPAIDAILNRSPVRVQIPTMVNGGPTATLSGGGFGDSFLTNPGTGGGGASGMGGGGQRTGQMTGYNGLTGSVRLDAGGRAIGNSGMPITSGGVGIKGNSKPGLGGKPIYVPSGYNARVVAFEPRNDPADSTDRETYNGTPSVYKSTTGGW